MLQDSENNLKKDIHLRPGERIDDLQRKGYVLIQDPSLFCFGMDAVLLADFTRAKKKDHVLDMCTGNGVIPVLLSARGKGGLYTGIEIQEKNTDLACRNADINGLGDRFCVIHGDICNTAGFLKAYARPSVDVITCNPPYMAPGDGLINPCDEKAAARHEISCTFRDIALRASEVLKEGGHIFIVHRPRRLAEIITRLCEAGLEPKRIRFVHSFKDKNAVMVLIDAVKGGGTQIITEPPLIIYGENGEYTDELKQMY